jgi:hypothetical protein
VATADEQGGRTVEIPADDVEALEFYAENTGVSFEAMAQLILTQGLQAYTDAQAEAGARTYFKP